jgi:rare lipoprotein A
MLPIQAIVLCFSWLSSGHWIADTSGRPLSGPIPEVQYGIASFYHNKFEGRKMANGELFSQQHFTAASNTLPLNCWVKVTNLRNQRSLILRITDRIHPKNKRLIDLSRSAAWALGYTGHGLTRVEVRYLGMKKPAETSSPSGNN